VRGPTFGRTTGGPLSGLPTKLNRRRPNGQSPARQPIVSHRKLLTTEFLLWVKGLPQATNVRCPLSLNSGPSATQRSRQLCAK
jgi:hypothetical protein